VKHRGINFSVVEMNFPHSWKWTVGKGKTVSVGVCATRRDAIRQAQTFIESVIDWQREPRRALARGAPNFPTTYVAETDQPRRSVVSIDQCQAEWALRGCRGGF
jgi:hypothetical protein